MIREMREEDAARLAEIYNYYVLNTAISFDAQALSKEEMLKRFDGVLGQYPCYVYEENGVIVGYCYAHPWRTFAAYAATWETTIYLAAEGCGKGIGRELMNQLMLECRKRACHVLIACVTAQNQASCRFHESLGFRPVGTYHSVGYKLGTYHDVVNYEYVYDDITAL